MEENPYESPMVAPITAPDGKAGKFPGQLLFQLAALSWGVSIWMLLFLPVVPIGVQQASPTDEPWYRRTDISQFVVAATVIGAVALSIAALIHEIVKRLRDVSPEAVKPKWWSLKGMFRLSHTPGDLAAICWIATVILAISLAPDMHPRRTPEAQLEHAAQNAFFQKIACVTIAGSTIVTILANLASLRRTLRRLFK